MRLADGSVQNSYMVKIANMTHRPQSYRLSVSGLDGLAVTGPGTERLPGGDLALSADAGTVRSHRIHVRSPASAAVAPSTPLRFTLTEEAGGRSRQVGTVFLAP